MPDYFTEDDDGVVGHGCVCSSRVTMSVNEWIKSYKTVRSRDIHTRVAFFSYQLLLSVGMNGVGTLRNDER